MIYTSIYLVPYDLILRDLGFIKLPNVATSRQLLKLVIVGNEKETFSEGSDTSKKIYDFIESKGSMTIIAG